MIPPGESRGPEEASDFRRPAGRGGQEGMVEQVDTFLEYLVKRKGDAKTLLYKMLIVLGVVVAAVLLLFLSGLFRGFSMIFLFAFAGACYGAWYLFTGLSVEYEYIVTNGEMDVDRIVAQRRRKRLATVRFRDMEIMAPLNGEHRREFENASLKLVDASASPLEKAAYGIVAHTEKLGEIKLVFTPDERILKAAQAVSPRKVFTA